MNLRPPGYEPDELPSCSTPRHSIAFIGDIDYYTLFQRFCQEGAESFFAAEAEGENAAADLLCAAPRQEDNKKARFFLPRAIVFLTFQNAPESFHWAVVNAVGYTRHALCHTRIFQHVVKA